MKYYIRINWNGKIEEVTAKRYWSLARNKKNKTDIYFDKGKKTARILTIIP